MNLTRRSVWTAVVLGALAGCTGEDTTTTPSNAGAPNPSLAPKAPVVPAPGKADAAKETPSKEMHPAPGEMKKEEPPKVEGPKTEGTGKGDTAASKLTADEIAAIKQLPASEQDLALKQEVCPVSDEHLGEMGKPVKMTVEGRTVFLCCDNCEKDLKADPKKYLAKLDAKSEKK
jgi:hypothetical protein